MTHLLFIDACPRGAGVSRSLALGEAFLQALLRLRPDTEVVRHTLNDLRLAALDGEALARREALIEARAWEDAMCAQARAFAEADEIVVAAPYWDLMFPAALKVYIEHIFVREMTFVYRDDRPVGLCRARRAAFFTTAGSPMGAKAFGVAYLRAALSMLGVRGFDSVEAEGLDIVTNDARALMEQALRRARALARTWAQA